MVAVEARNHPTASAVAKRDLQRRRRLRPGQPEAHAGTDHRHRADHLGTGVSDRSRNPGGSRGYRRGRGALTGAAVTALATILLSGMLTVVVARAVVGAPITIAEAWHRVRGRMAALIALTVLEALSVLL